MVVSPLERLVRLGRCRNRSIDGSAQSDTTSEWIDPPRPVFRNNHRERPNKLSIDLYCDNTHPPTMKLIISAFIALFAVVPVLAAETPQPPPLASELVNPLTVIIVTPWDTGDIGGIDVAKIDDMIPVDDNSYKRIKTYGPSDKAASASSNFAIQREIWGNYYYGVSLIQQYVLRCILILHSVWSG